MQLWRIAGAAYPVWNAEGARRRGGRWNPPGAAVIYAGTSYAIAALEILVHAGIGKIPGRFKYVRAELPRGAPAEEADLAQLRNWNGPDVQATQTYGRTWLESGRSLALIVPSVVTGGLDRNALVNPRHPDFSRITLSEEAPAVWDPRLTVL